MHKYVLFVLTIIFLMVLLFVVYPASAIATPLPTFSNRERSPLARPQLELCSARANERAFSEFTGWDVDSFLTLGEFAASLENGDPNAIVGVFVCRVLALKITQQPMNDPVYVSNEMGTATQFRLAAGYGTLGLLAHNDRSGARFFGLRLGHQVDVVYGDGTVRRYVVSRIRHFQPLNADDPYSNFFDLDNGGDPLTSTQVFQQIFVGDDQVVFQTCIPTDGNPIWGRLFVIATPMSLN